MRGKPTTDWLAARLFTQPPHPSGFVAHLLPQGEKEDGGGSAGAMTLC